MEYKSSVPFFVLLHVLSITTCHALIFFSILNFSYFIKRVKLIHDKLKFVEYRMVHSKWYIGYALEKM